MKRIGFILLLCGMVSVLYAQGERQKYAILIGGLGGSPEHQELFREYLFQTHQAFIGELGFPEANVTVFGERAIADEVFVNEVGTADAIRAHFANLAAQVQPIDEVYVMLFGHGSFDGTSAKLNIPRRDLADTDYAELLSDVAAERMVFVNTASASGPFIDALSRPNLVVLTATQTGTQRNLTRFPKYFIEALTNPAADGDKNGDLSIKEIFNYTAESTLRSYEAEGHLATERPMLDDNGDGQGTRSDQLEGAADGNIASVMFVKRQSLGGVLAAGGEANPELQTMLRDKEALERDIADLKGQKSILDIDTYYERLEVLFVQLSRLNEQVESLMERPDTDHG